jgi:hypothetical protein
MKGLVILAFAAGFAFPLHFDPANAGYESWLADCTPATQTNIEQLSDSCRKRGRLYLQSGPNRWTICGGTSLTNQNTSGSEARALRNAIINAIVKEKCLRTTPTPDCHMVWPCVAWRVIYHIDVFRSPIYNPNPPSDGEEITNVECDSNVPAKAQWEKCVVKP